MLRSAANRSPKYPFSKGFCSPPDPGWSRTPVEPHP